MPEERMSLDFDKLVECHITAIIFINMEPFKVFEMYRHYRAVIRILDLKGAISQIDLKPVVPIELADQVGRGVTERELLGVPGEHHL